VALRRPKTAALSRASWYSPAGCGVVGHPSPCAIDSPVSFPVDQGGADGDVEGPLGLVTGVGPPEPDCPAVDPPRSRFEVGDDLHGGHLGGAGDGSTGEESAEETREGGAGKRLRLDRGSELPDGVVFLGREEGGDPD
jgi:hypothetical protein